MEATHSAPLTIKGVCLDGAGRVLLCRNDRREWELPGGRPEAGEAFPDCLVREIGEETGLAATVHQLLAAYPYEVLPGRWVNVIVYRCELRGSGEPVASHEHDRVAFFAPDALGAAHLAEGYRLAVEAALTNV